MPFQKEGENQAWRPSLKQEEFLRIPFEVFEALFGGAAGPGKSELILLAPLIYQFHENPHFNGIVFRRTFPELEGTLIPRSHEYFRPFGATYNAQKHLWTFPSGARFGFGYCKDENDVYNYQSAEFHYIGFDELTHFTHFQYSYLTSRVRKVGENLPTIIRSATNPGGIGHTWVKNYFIKPSPVGGKLAYNDKSKTYRIFIKALPTDNPYLLRDDPGYYDRLKLLPHAHQKALIEGDWDAFAGQVFTEFRSARHPLEPENAVHVIEPFYIPEWWPKIIGCDWGFRANTWVGWAAISPSARIILYREYICQKKQIRIWGADIARLSQFDGNIKKRFLDPSAWKQEGHEHNIADQLITATNANWEPADNDRIGGKLLIHELLRWEPRPKSFLPRKDYNFELESKILRFHGKDAAESYKRMFEEQPEENNIPRLQIFNTCTNIIEAIQSAVYKENAKGKAAEDVAEYEGDDPYDGFRYLTKGVDYYLNESKKEFEERSQLDSLIKQRDETGDMTQFYRAMEYLEAQKSRMKVAKSDRMAKYAQYHQKYLH